MRVRITKRAEVTGGAPARDAQDHIAGRQQPAGFSIPVDYTVEGYLTRPIAVGRPVEMIRDTRNGVKAEGIFQTSPVVESTGATFRTRNSVYDISFQCSDCGGFDNMTPDKEHCPTCTINPQI